MLQCTARTVLRTVLLALLCACSTSSQSESRRLAASERAGFAFWGHQVALVVTWHNRSIAWLERYPLDHLAVALFVKGGNGSCADVPERVQRAVVVCDSGYNADGREAHTMALFITRYYDALPRVSIFVHDQDDARLDPLLGLTREGMSAWVRSVVDQPRPLFQTPRTGLCSISRESFWRDEDPRKVPALWFLEHILGYKNVSTRWHSWTFPPTAQLAVPSRAIHDRPELVYRLILELTNGTTKALETDQPRLVYSGPENGHLRPWSAFSWAHTLERLWFPIFDLDFDPDFQPEAVKAR